MHSEDPAAPTGTVTFLFTDIEGSTVRWDTAREAMQAAVRRHDEMMRSAIESNEGYVFKTIGDAFCAAFSRPTDALKATFAAQRAFAEEDWSAVGGLRVRMALHAGVADERDNDYFGPTVNRVARLLAIGHGAQVLVSSAAATLSEGQLPAQYALIDLGTHRLKDLSVPERVYQLAAPGLVDKFPALRSLDVVPNNLPAQLAPLIGRETETSEIKAMLERSRLVTLLGSGGIGKTRTALQIAADLATGDGAWFVDLAAVDDARLVPSAIAAVFGIADEGGPKDLMTRVASALKLKKLLVVIDNCEHLIGAVAAAVDRLLQEAKDVRVLATSREPLAITGEELYRMPSLGVPPEDERMTAERVAAYPAVALFAARARAAQQTFTITDQNAEIVAAIVRRLDGIALAIELAAPKVAVLKLPQLLDRLDDRLKLLTGGSRTALPRQQTLRALIGWSYELLSDVERSVFRQLAVFRGSFTLEAIEAVWQDDAFAAADTLSLVATLVDKSLLVPESDGDAEQRYRLLASTREYAHERSIESGERDSVAARHAAFYRELSSGIGERFWKTDSDVWKTTVRRDLENYRAAIAYGLELGDGELAAETIGELRWYWHGSSGSEGRRLVEAAIAATAGTSGGARGLLPLTAALLNANYGSQSAAAAALDVFADGKHPIALVEALSQLAEAAIASGRTSDAVTLSERAAGVARTSMIPRLLAFVLTTAAYCRQCDNDDAAAHEYLDEALPIARRCNDGPVLARLNVIRAELSFKEGAVSEALVCVREAGAIYRERKHEVWLCVTLLNEAAYLLEIDEFDEAGTAVREALELAIERDDEYFLRPALGHVARIAAQRGATGEAARLLGFVDAAYATAGSVRELTEQKGYDEAMNLLRGALPADRVAGLLAEGSSLTRDDAVQEAIQAIQ